MVVLPWLALRDFTSELSLNRIVYVIRFRHNHLNDRFSLDFFSGQTPIILGVAVVKGVDLLAHMPDQFHPGGHMFVDGMDPTYENLVSGASLVVFDAAL
ncbi:MAG: hypothetical protein DI556_09820 [Rhodovulum sulfidophilum]|uniref:Cyanophage baseplate Pam3 plug gp18 domain-containing protein n=1 Tax=Rhodovulum sulfidophilum TaxID=35806 RepID=A0A2W5NBZ5_RHOSU|nr:MAG: hypothetical protein DI556_09820 [Rhodovulum sulfidophilum]